MSRPSSAKTAVSAGPVPPVRRAYDDGCATAHALNLIGERWALLVVRELLLGPRRFSDLRTALPGLSANVLTQRLVELGEAGVLRKRRLGPPASLWVYELTSWGQELEVVVAELGRWGARSTRWPRDRPMSTASLVLAMRSMFDAAAADGVRMSLGLSIGGAELGATVAKRAIAVEPGLPLDPDVRIASDADTLASLAFDGSKLADAVEAGRAAVDGDRSVAKRFFKLFKRPAPAGG